MPPYWAWGIHQCRWGYKNTFVFEGLYDNYINKQIPLDAMWLDIDAMNNYEIFTLNQKKFGNLPQVINCKIHKNHAKFIPIIDIAISYDPEEKNEYAKIGDENNLFIKSGFTKQNLLGKVWPKKTVFPDFFNPNINKLWDFGLNKYYDFVDYGLI